MVDFDEFKKALPEDHNLSHKEIQKLNEKAEWFAEFALIYGQKGYV